jgi:hypothetical protein
MPKSVGRRLGVCSSRAVIISRLFIRSDNFFFSVEVLNPGEGGAALSYSTYHRVRDKPALSHTERHVTETVGVLQSCIAVVVVYREVLSLEILTEQIRTPPTICRTSPAATCAYGHV